MRLFVAGGAGLLGSDLLPAARARGWEAVSPAHAAFDVAEPTDVARLSLGELGPFDWIVNLAAFTNVDLAERERGAAAALNAIAPGYLASAAEALGARMLHVSTDYVFGARPGAPYAESDAPAPAQYYGESKLEGETAVAEHGADAIVARVAWLYGAGRKCFASSVVEACREGRTLRLVEDQFGTPGSTLETARMLLDLLQARAPGGVYHVVGGERANRVRYGQAFIDAWAERAGRPGATVEPVAAAEFFTGARRPSDSSLQVGKALAYTEPHASLEVSARAFVAHLV